MTVLSISLCGKAASAVDNTRTRNKRGSMMEFSIPLHTTVARVVIVVLVEPPVMAIDANVNVIADGVIAKSGCSDKALDRSSTPALMIVEIPKRYKNAHGCFNSVKLMPAGDRSLWIVLAGH